MERRRLRSQQKGEIPAPAPPRESLVSWVSETTRSSMDPYLGESGADSSTVQDSQNLDQNPAYIPGQIITTCRPFVHIATEEMKGRICDLCLRPPNSISNSSNSKLRCCSECQAMFFCGSCLASTTPSVFKALHALECPIYAAYSSVLSNPSKLFLRLYLRLAHPESIPHTTSYFNPLTREELDFDQLVPRLIYNSHDEMAEHIKDFCERHSLNINGGNETVNSPSSSKGAKNRKKKNRKNKEISEDQPIYKSVTDFHLHSRMSVEEIACYQFMNLLEEFSRVEPLLPMLSDDTRIYHLWTIFIRLWSYATPIVDEAVSGILSDSSSSAIAYGLYLEPNSVLFGHSCLPNTALAFYGPVLQLRAMKAIYPGDSLMVNLVQLGVPQAERLRQLRSYFISTCFCARCRGKTEEEVKEEDGDGVLSAADYETFRALKEEFNGLFQAAFTTTSKELANSSSFKTPLSLSAILNFNSENGRGGVFYDQTILESSQKCDKLHGLSKRLLPLLEKIYPYSHPEKSRFAYAQTVVEMNRLLFKLDRRASTPEKEVQTAKELEKSNRFSKTSAPFSQTTTTCSEFSTPTTNRNRMKSRMSDFSDSVSPRAGNLDALTEEINAWSSLLKSTVKSIRITHGIDHRLYREVEVPLAPIWAWALAQGSTKSSAALSLGELHQNPAVLLRILVHSGSSRGSTNSNSFSIESHLESISRVFGQLFADNVRDKSSTSYLDGMLKNSNFTISPETADHCWSVLFRAVLVFFALLFPLFIYYVTYVENL